MSLLNNAENRMWSDNKKIDITINVLLFLMASNFLHLGQLFLPIICLILFIDNKYKIHVNNIKVFVLLCLFAITFCIFSYKLGFYCVMGFCLPMAYFIGSNLKYKTQDNVIKIIYILAFGMATYLILNLLLELYFWHDNLSYMFNKPSHYELWLYILKYPVENVKDIKVNTTGMSINFLFISSMIYYVIKYEKEKRIKLLVIVLFLLSSIYCIALARRTTLIMFIISMLFSVFFDVIFIKKHKAMNFSKISLSIICILIIIIIIYFNNFLNVKNIFDNLMIVKKIRQIGFSTYRLQIFFNNFKLYPKYMWGGRKISDFTGYLTHNLWGDIYDYAGIIPYLLSIVLTILTIIKIIKLLSNKNINIITKLLYSVILINMCLIMFVEPIMTGMSIFMISSVLVLSTMFSIIN